MSGILHDPDNHLPTIGRIWAYLSRDDAGREGLCGTTIGGVFMPLIAADQARLKDITPYAEALAAVTGKAIVLVEFTGRVELRTITGKADG